MYAIKTKSGKIPVASARDSKKECVDDYVMNLLDKCAMIDRPEYYGPDLCNLHWHDLELAGFSVVPVVVDMRKCRDWHYPVCVERSPYKAAVKGIKR